MLEANSVAPDFTLKDSNNNDVSLSSFKGKKVVLYFYPKDNTSGCSKQAIEFKNYYEEFKKKGVVVIGVSKDSIDSHVKFISKYDLPFTLLSDPSLEVIKAYKVYGEKKLYGKPYMGVIRTTYVIDERGIIISAKEKVNPSNNASETLCEI